MPGEREIKKRRTENATQLFSLSLAERLASPRRPCRAPPGELACISVTEQARGSHGTPHPIGLEREEPSMASPRSPAAPPPGDGEPGLDVYRDVPSVGLELKR